MTITVLCDSGRYVRGVERRIRGCAVEALHQGQPVRPVKRLKMFPAKGIHKRDFSL